MPSLVQLTSQEQHHKGISNQFKVHNITRIMPFFDAIGREVPYLYFYFIDIWTKNKEHKGLQGQKQKYKGY